MADLETTTQVISLDAVMRYFAKGFKPAKIKGKKREIVGMEYYVDPAKGMVIFQLTISTEAPK